jgi:hypothetical protein
MTHIAIVTALLGLMLGPHDIELTVSGPVARVELQIDGRAAAVIEHPPWKAAIDLGPRLLPHDLVARALDASGNELARTEETINVPHPLSEVQLVLEHDANGRPAGVQVVWRSVESDLPNKIALSLDGSGLPIDARLHAALPRLDLTRPHMVRVRAVARSGATESEIAFGGGLEDQAGSHLTPVAVRVLRKGADIEHALKIGNAPAHVIAVEELPGEVIVVRHPRANEAALRLDPGSLNMFPRRPVPMLDTAHQYPTVAFVWPVANRSEASVNALLFDSSVPFQFANAADLKAILTRVVGPLSPRLLYAQAVAIAGLRAMSTRQPRAVILVLGSTIRDESQVLPAQARDYLRAIGVPFYLWTLGPGSTHGWDEPIDVSSPVGYRRAFESLQKDLQSQRIVWIEGDHLPADVQSVSADVETIAKQ